ncbi:oligosaccharide flippase family protein [Candidatus Uhrbacteria bacterium]|nr:oligosaccharide flippase family protein [Candidatus Uhrbacteria bacterium]
MATNIHPIHSPSHHTKRFVRALESLFKVDVLYIFKNGSWVTFGQILVSIASFVMAIVFARILPKETYGTYRFVISAVGILSITSLFGMAHAVTRAAALNADQTLQRGTWMRVRWSMLGSILSISYAGYQWIQQEPTLALTFLLVAAVLPLIEPLQTAWAFLSGKKAFGSFAIVRSSTLITSILLAVLTSFFTHNIFILVSAYYLPNAFLRLMWFYWVKRRYVQNKVDQPETYALGKHFSAMTILTGASEHIDKIILFGLLGPVEVAAYSLAMIPIQQSFVYIGGITGIAMPKFTQRSFEEIREHLPGKLLRMILVLVPLTIALILIIPTFFQTLFPNYPESILYAQIAAIALLFQGSQLIPMAFMAHGKIKDLYLIRAVQPAVQLTLFAVLIPIYGILGAVIAFVLGHGIGMIIQSWLLIRSGTKKTL